MQAPVSARTGTVLSHQTHNPLRRQQALRRLAARQARRPVRRTPPDRAPSSLVQVALETIQLVEQRIAYWMEQGDQEHVLRLEAIRRQLTSTYLRS